MVRPCSKNGRRKFTQNSIEVDAETKESTRKTEEKLDGRYKEGHYERNLHESQWEDRKQWSLGVGQRTTTFWNRYIHACFGHLLCPSSGVFHCTHNNGTRHTGLLTACKLSANLYDLYHSCVYSEKLLMMGRGTVRNM